MFRWKKIFLLLITTLIGLLAIFLFFDFKKPTIHSKSGILMDASNGDILFEKDAEAAYPVASMSKLMTMYIVLDQIESGMIHWNDEVVISGTANSVVETAVIIPIDAGDSLTVEDLFKAMVISSANNATIALAEYIAGTEEGFTKLMNEKAIDLGLSTQTYFVNATGLPSPNNEENRMSSKDVAMLAYQLLSDYSQDVLETATMQQYHIPTYDIVLFSTNAMLSEHDNTYIKGMDGLKTGFTNAAGYCFVGTAAKKDKRLISVIIHAESDEARFIETKKLLSYGFEEFTFPSFKEVMMYLFR